MRRGSGSGSGSRGSRGGGAGGGDHRNLCLTMHQPWASLLVHGIKRIEGRSWPAPFTGRLWIHAAAKVPDPSTIRAMEDFYREIYAVNGITDIKFPGNYPVSRLLGCVEVVGCVKCSELAHWEEVPESVRLEGQTDFCWLCEQPQKLVVSCEMRGYHGVYNLERKIFEAVTRGLCPIEGPQPVKFPLPDRRNPLSLKSGSLALHSTGSKAPVVEKPHNLDAAIAGARAAATQFLRKDQSRRNIVYQAQPSQNSDTVDFEGKKQPKIMVAGDHTRMSGKTHNRGAMSTTLGLLPKVTSSKPMDPLRHTRLSGASNTGRVLLDQVHKDTEQNTTRDSDEENSIGRGDGLNGTIKPQLGSPSKLFAAAMKELRMA